MGPDEPITLCPNHSRQPRARMPIEESGQYCVICDLNRAIHEKTKLQKKYERLIKSILQGLKAGGTDVYFKS
jgi:hypothetical protein